MADHRESCRLASVLEPSGPGAPGTEIIVNVFAVLLAQFVFLCRIPLTPPCVVPLQHIPRQYAITGSISDIDMDGPAAHSNHDIQVDLWVVRDALLGDERVRYRAGESSSRFRDEQ
jgi:hypothetical protein